MDNKKTITIIILGLVAIAGILLFLFLPSKSHLANIDFYVYDTNDNFHYEVNERLELLVNDTAAIKGKRLIWEMGNGDTLMRNTDVSYTYRKAGKYLITLKSGVCYGYYTLYYYRCSTCRIYCYGDKG